MTNVNTATVNNTIVIKAEVIADIIAMARSGNNANIPAEYRRNMIAVIEMEATTKKLSKEYITVLVAAINSIETEMKLDVSEIPSASGVSLDDTLSTAVFKKEGHWHSSKYCLIYGSLLATITDVILNGPTITGAVTGAVMGTGAYFTGNYVQEKFGDEITGKLGSTFLGFAVTSSVHYGANMLMNKFVRFDAESEIGEVGMEINYVESTNASSETSGAESTGFLANVMSNLFN